MTRVIAYLEQQALDESVDWGFPAGQANPPWPPGHVELIAARLPVFECPSDPSASKLQNPDLDCFGAFTGKTHGRLSYAANFGRGQMTAPGRVAGVFGKYYGARIADIHDGTSNTLLVSEIIPGGRCTIRGAHSYDEGPVIMQDYGPNDLTPDLVRICDASDANSPVAPCAHSSGNWGTLTELDMVLHTSRSMHPGGVMAGLCDGSSRFVSETIALDIWQSLGTPDGGEVLSGEF